jgi:lysophospholipase L1-like esterase
MLRLPAVALLTGLLAAPLAAQSPDERFARWEKEIAAIEKRLKENPPPKGGVAFIGSSTIRLWDLKKSFPDRDVVNVGFGGSEIRDSTHFAGRILFPLEPRTIVFYAGDNDLASGRTPEQVRDDFRAFVAAVREKLPKTKVLFVAVKPSVKRWAIFDRQTRANGLVEAVCQGDDRLGYIDVVPAMLGPDGKPPADLFVADGLHLSPKGYAIWTKLVAAALRD